MKLEPIMPPGATQLTLSDGGSYLLYKIPDGHNWATVQLDGQITWTATTVVTVQFGSTEGNQYALTVPVSFSAYGIKTLDVVDGYLRLYVSTAAAGTAVVTPTVRTGRAT